MATNCLTCGVLLVPGNYYPGNKARCKTHYNERAALRPRQQRVSYTLLTHARYRAKDGGYPCTISEEDISVPSHCPVLGMPLERGPRGKGVVDGSPSLDKVRPELGYVPGNIRVISFKANRLKSSASLEEVRAILRYMEQHEAA